MGNDRTKITANLLWTYAEKFLAQGITLLVSIILARILDPDQYGTIAIVTVFITIGDALVTGGFGNALVQKKNSSDLDFNSICWLSLFVAVILYGILFISAKEIANFYDANILVPVIRVMGIKFIFSAINSIQQAYVQKQMMFKKFFFATLGGTLFSGVFGLALALSGYGVWALVGQYLSNTVINTLILAITIKWKLKFQISWKSIKELWKFGSKMLASTIVYTVKDNIRSLIIGKKFTSADLAYYNQGNRFPALLVTNIVESLGTVIFPVLSMEQDSKGNVRNFMRKSIRISSFILTPTIVGLLAVGDTFISVILTEKWAPCVPYLRILCLVYMTRPLSTIFQKGLLAIGKSNINLFQEIVTSILTIILLVIAVFKFNSISFIAWSYVVIMIVGLGIFAFFVNKYLGYSFREMAIDYCPSLGMSCVMGIIVFFIGYIPIHSLIKLVIQFVVGVTVYVLIAYIGKREEMWNLTELLKKIIGKKH